MSENFPGQVQWSLLLLHILFFMHVNVVSPYNHAMRVSVFILMQMPSFILISRACVQFHMVIISYAENESEFVFITNSHGEEAKKREREEHECVQQRLSVCDVHRRPIKATLENISFPLLLFLCRFSMFTFVWLLSMILFLFNWNCFFCCFCCCFINSRFICMQGCRCVKFLLDWNFSWWFVNFFWLFFLS